MDLRLPLFLLVTAVAALAQEHAHPHDETPATTASAETTGPVRLTEAMVKNLGLATVEVELRPMERTFRALGTVDPEPGRVVAVTARVPGRVTKLAVHDGQRVAAGDFLAEVEARVVADPPPTLKFTAPFAGTVLETKVVPGGPVEPGESLLTLIDLSEVDVVARIFETQIGQVRPGQTVRVYPIAYPDASYVGKVKRTAANVDRESGTLRVFVQTENPDGRLLPGMRAELAFVVEETDAAVVVPRSAVLGEGGDRFVFRELEPGPFTYERTPVIIGLRNERFIEIIDGVLPGDRVVARGNYPLQFVGGGGAPTIEDDHGHSHGPGGHQH